MGRALHGAVLLGALGTALGSPDAAADPQPFGAGGVPGPLIELPVRIAGEDLLVELILEEARVQATLLLHNEGPATKLDVGFPCAPAREEALAELT